MVLTKRLEQVGTLSSSHPFLFLSFFPPCVPDRPSKILLLVQVGTLSFFLPPLVWRVRVQQKQVSSRVGREQRLVTHARDQRERERDLAIPLIDSVERPQIGIHAFLDRVARHKDPRNCDSPLSSRCDSV